MSLRTTKTLCLSRKWLTIAFSAFSLILSATEVEKTPTTKGTFQLADVMWQILDGVQTVAVGPDDRLWLQKKHERYTVTLKQMKGSIAASFHDKTPCFHGARPVLFEPDGRVWFLTDNGRILLGYDGTSWIERKLGKKEMFTGNCPNHGRECNGGYNVQCGHNVFFLESKGIHSFDGKDWKVHKFPEGQIKSKFNMRLRIEPDGQGVLAIYPGSPPYVWRWRNGTWREIKLKSDQIRDVFPADCDGIWLLTKSNALEFFSLTDKAEVNELFDSLASKLKMAKTKRSRQAVGDKMIALGVSIKPLVEKALSETYDSGLIEELVRVSSVLTKGCRTRIEDYEISSLKLLHHDAQSGVVRFAVKGVTKNGAPLGEGVLTLNDKNGVLFDLNPLLLNTWRAAKSQARTNILAVDGRGFWLEGPYREPVPHFIDSQKRVVTAKVPLFDFQRLHAVRRDGTVFVGTMQVGQRSAVLAAYQPEKVDTRRRIPTKKLKMSENSKELGLDSQGAIWMGLGEKGIFRFSHGDLSSIPKLETAEELTLFIPGNGGRVIGRTDLGFFYHTPEKITLYKDLKRMVATNRQDIVKSFGTMAAASHCVGLYECGLVADKAGNIWLLWEEQLSVLVDEEWIPAKPALLAAGSRRGSLEYVNTVGGREKVYLTDFKPYHDKGRSFFGTVKDGRLVFSKAPHTCERKDTCRGVRDQEDALWIAGAIQGSGGTCDWIQGQLALRVDDGGVAGKLKNQGWASLRDESGNIWLGNARGGKDDEFLVWLRGEIVDRIRVPAANEYSQIGSDKPGSVYLWTNIGLYHLVSNTKSQFTDFDIANLYTPGEIRGYSKSFLVSKQGYAALVITENPHREKFVTIFKLPEEDVK